MKLSKRLSAIYDLVPVDAIVGDIGADHGFLSIRLANDGIAKRVFCNENKMGPYQVLKQTVINYCATEIVEVSYSDGLDVLPSDINTLIIAGMGTELIINILDKHKTKLEQINTLILSSHTLVDVLRKYVINLGFMIDEEVMIKEKHFYQIIRFKKGEMKLSANEYYFGPILLKKRSSEFMEYYKMRLVKVNELLALNLSSERKTKLLKEKERIESL